MAKPKALTWDQLRDRKQRAVQFLTAVLRDEQRADEVEQESLADYAARRGLTVAENPHEGKSPMASNRELQEEIRALESALESVQDVLDEVYEPESTREQLASAIGEALDEIEEALGEEAEGEEEDEG